MTYMKHPKLKRKKGESEKAYDLRRKRNRAQRRKLAEMDTLRAPLKIIHPWIADREIHEAHIVLRIDDYSTMSSDRGQFYPAVERTDDKMKAIWSSRQKAIDAATWAAQKFGRQYGVFKMVAIVETTVRPIRVVEV